MVATNDSPSQHSPDPSPAPHPSSTPALTWMLALRQASESQLGANGVPGDSFRVGRLMAETLAGLKQSASYSSSSPSPQPFPEAPTSRSSEITEGSSKAGGRAGAETNPQTTFSETFTLSRKRKASSSTLDTSLARTTQPTALPEGSTRGLYLPRVIPYGIHGMNVG